MNDKSVEQEIERIIRLELNAKYQSDMDYWKILSKDSTLDNLNINVTNEHILFAILLRLIDRIDDIEKLLHAQKEHNTEADIQ